MAARTTDKETTLIIEQAAHLAEKLKIKKILVVCESLSLWKALLPYYANHHFVIALSSKRLAGKITVETFLSDFNDITRRDRLDYILRSAIEAEKVKTGVMAAIMSDNFVTRSSIDLLESSDDNLRDSISLLASFSE